MVSRALTLGSLLAGEVAAVVGLHALGGLPWFALPSGDVGTWLTTSAPEDVAVALLRLVALGGAYWLALSTAAYTLARVSRLPAAVRGTRWATLPAVRRVADRAVAVSMAASLAGGSVSAAFAGVGEAMPATAAQSSAVAAEPPSPAARASGAGEVLGESGARVSADGIPPPAVTPESLPLPEVGEPPDEVGGDVSGGRDPGVSGDEGGVSPQVHVVEPGDHLWGVAAADVAAASGRDPSGIEAEEVTPRWRAVVDANRGRLRSGDPDLIYPGERIELPSDDD